MRNGFFDNAQLYGMPYPVEGGTEIIYTYEVWIKKEGKPAEYAKVENGICTKTTNYAEATAFTKECAERVAIEANELLEKSHENFEIKVVPKAHYETLRGNY